MSDQLALLRAIADNPDDDTPRLVYADWLQENGQPERASFIRMQCEFQALPLTDPRRAGLDATAEAILSIRFVLSPDCVRSTGPGLSRVGRRTGHGRPITPRVIR